MSGIPPADVPSSMVDHYASGVEAGRLDSAGASLELLRTQEILTRFLPTPPAVIYDIGGGPGSYAAWLARLGYEVHLVDIMPLHVQQALEASAAQAEHPIATCTVGDARQLKFPHDSAAVVLLLGPLYHLTERADRITTLREAARVVRPGGLVFAAAISRFASALDGLDRGFLADDEFRDLMQADLLTGQHRNPNNHEHYFTTAYFHRPEELRVEFDAAGLTHMQTLAVEGPGAMVRRVTEQWDDPDWRARVLDLVRRIEHEPSLIGASPHLIAIGRK